MKKIVNFFHKSYESSNILKKKQNLDNDPIKKLIQSVSTRWNSDYLMVLSVFENRERINEILKIFKKDKYLIEEYELITDLINILEPFYFFTNDISFDKKSTIGSLFFLLKKLKKIYSSKNRRR